MFIPEERWIEISRSFIDAYSLFYKEGKETTWIKLNNRDIEITFLPNDNNDPNLIKVILYCPEIERFLEPYFDLSTHATEEIIKMLYWLAKKPQFLDITKITTSDSEEEYEQLRETLVGAYQDCYYDPASEAWEEVGTEIRIIELHDRVFKVIFELDDNGIIDVYIDCVTTKNYCTRCVYIEEQNPEDIIRLIQDLAWEET
ncbi:hypothetical protein [Ruminococcus sp.]|jgi:hypothetical protein|uniref:hypothetical protein n=1 Tax=Ruminococcus sp. TaxID=41978 RepID=UPI0025F12FD0|nr:hypothetical protein [Ruminococcus sp.]